MSLLDHNKEGLSQITNGAASNCIYPFYQYHSYPFPPSFEEALIKIDKVENGFICKAKDKEYAFETITSLLKFLEEKLK